MEGTTDRSVAMEAFRQRAMSRSSVPTGGSAPTPGMGAAPGAPVTGGVPSGGAGGAPQGDITASTASNTTEILKQATGEITQDEMTEVLIKRLKNLMSDKQESKGGASAQK